MRFIHTAAQALLAFTTILSGVAGAPATDGTLTADDAASKTLSQRDVYIAADDALPALSGRDIDSGSNLAKRGGAPTEDDFQEFFASEPQKSKLEYMVFWSGMGPEAAAAFAKSKGRYTMEMLVGDNWKEFQKPSGGHWPSWAAAVAGFWDLISQACARASRGEVLVYMLPQGDLDQQQDDPSRGNCGTCWYRKEKPALIAGLGRRVTQITKFLTTNKSQSAGQIYKMADKI